MFFSIFIILGACGWSWHCRPLALTVKPGSSQLLTRLRDINIGEYAPIKYSWLGTMQASPLVLLCGFAGITLSFKC